MCVFVSCALGVCFTLVCVFASCACVCVCLPVSSANAQKPQRETSARCVSCVHVCVILCRVSVSQVVLRSCLEGLRHECVSCMCANVFCTLSTDSVSSHAQKPSKETLAMVCCVCVRVFCSVEC